MKARLMRFSWVDFKLLYVSVFALVVALVLALAGRFVDALVCVVMGLAGLAWRAHDRRERREAVAHEAEVQARRRARYEALFTESDTPVEEAATGDAEQAHRAERHTVD